MATTQSKQSKQFKKLLESDFNDIIRKAISDKYGEAAALYKNHGNQFQVEGRPDLEGSICGRHVGFEVKVYPNKPSAPQVREVEFLTRAGSITGVITYKEGKFYFVELKRLYGFTYKEIMEWRQIGSIEHGFDTSFIDELNSDYMSAFVGV